MLVQALRRFQFEPFVINHLIDARQRYDLELDPRFPFAIKLFSYDSADPPYPMNWHERLELFVPIAGEGKFATGDEVAAFSPGDVIVVDTMKLHGLAEFKGITRRAVIVTFLAEFVCQLGGAACDAVFLSPFYGEPESQARIVRSTDRMAGALHSALARLVQCYFTAGQGPRHQAGCKLYLLEVMYTVLTGLGWTEGARSEYLRRQEQSQALGRLHAYLLDHFTEKLPVATAASLVNMSESKFMKYFKSVTGETFVSYVNRLRVERAAKHIDESNSSVANIAESVGFSDQSYFDKIFRRYFQCSPRDYRHRAALEKVRHDSRG